MTKQYTNTREPGEFGDGVTVGLEPNAMTQQNQSPVGVTREDAIAFLESACRNWTRVPALSEDDIGDVATELLRFTSKRLETLTQPSGKVSAHVHRLIYAGDQFAAFDQHMTEKHDEASALWVATRKEWDKRRADAQASALEAAQLPARPVVTPDDDIHELYLDALVEAEKAMRRYPQPNYVISKVAEEAGEVVKDAIHCAEGRETHAKLVGEIKQAIAMLLRLYIEGDQVHGLTPPRAALSALEGESQ